MPKEYNISHLSTGGDDPFLPRLLEAINAAREIDIAVAFIRNTGLNLIYQALQDALKRDDEPARIRILTGDYLQVTEPQALSNLMLLQEPVQTENGKTNPGADVRIYANQGDQSFHMKTYIFIAQDSQGFQGRAFVGSSNLSKMALTDGLEWNLRVEHSENPERFDEIRQKFEALYQHPNTLPLSHEWIDNYKPRFQQAQSSHKPVSEDIPEPPPTPNPIQIEVLDSLHNTRDQGYRRGLVVMATGMGKTWLAAFDARAMNAKRILFVAHREEILDQAERTFVRIFPDSKVGRYTGQERQLNMDMLFASVQTLGKARHLDKFRSDYFDYIIIDEFHHAAARTYQQLLAHFQPRFLLGLTATPERTDQADILQLCDDNLVFRKDLTDGIENKLLCPFHYYGIGDQHVNYREIPWRSTKFDTDALVNQLATQARARHVLNKWQELHQSRTLAFCVSQRHADFMADYFNRQGILAISVHSESAVRRNDAIARLTTGETQVVFSVDLFNEGVDVPAIDTVLMLRPTESKILFLQQLGRGLRRSEETDKSHLVIMDFIGNHVSFFRKPEALFKTESNNSARRGFIDQAESGTLPLPPGCFANYDLTAIDFMRSLLSTRADIQLDIYLSLKESLDRRPTLSEFYMAGGAVSTVRGEHGQWFGLVSEQGDLNEVEREVFSTYGEFLKEVEITPMTRSFKMILLLSFIDLEGFSSPVELNELANASFERLRRMVRLAPDLPPNFQDTSELDHTNTRSWLTYWKSNPIAAWTGQNTNRKSYFTVKDDRFAFTKTPDPTHLQILATLTQELANYRLSQYETRNIDSNVVELSPADDRQQIPYFPDLKIACGHFRTSEHDTSGLEYKTLPNHYGTLNPARHFIARATGNSMDGSKNPIKDGDYLLLELVTSENAGSNNNQTIAIERQDVSGDDQYLLRDVRKRSDGGYDLVARNPDYAVIQATDEMQTRARLKSIIDPFDIALHQEFMRADIPPLFGLEFNTGLWQQGYVSPKESSDQFLLVTLNKQSKQAAHQYHDYFIDRETLHWQSQNRTDATNAQGRKIIDHEKHGSKVFLFVRKISKTSAGTAAPFYFCGSITYKSHSGSKPLDVIWELDNKITPDLFEYFKP